MSFLSLHAKRILERMRMAGVQTTWREEQKRGRGWESERERMGEEGLLRDWCDVLERLPLVLVTLVPIIISKFK